MPAIRLGKMVLQWCNTCNVPILNLKTCNICNNKTQEVTYTPPGDIRPAFDFDIGLIKKVIDSQFGKGCGIDFIPKNSVIILNRAPDLDRLDEIIFNGKVQGALKYDLDLQKFKFLPRLSGARMFLKNLKKGYVVVDEGAKNPICNGSNVLAPGIVEVSSGIKIKDEVIVLDGKKNILGVGIATMSSHDMRIQNHGMSVKIRWHVDTIENENRPVSESSNECNNKLNSLTKSKLKIEHKNAKLEKQVKLTPSKSYRKSLGAWEVVIEENKPELDRIVKEAIESIKSTTKKFQLPVADSFSGGKDSLATLLLVLETQIKPKLFFINTGLEFPETIEHVNNISKKFNLKLVTGEPTNTFWDGLKYFGPPGKDYRWCCKTCKLGPTTQLIKSQFPKGVLMFIGQRRYESEERSNKGMIWNNPWVPGQVGASPIQHWSALHIWLYLFKNNVEFNKLYENGLERIGCWLCPASDMADFITVSKSHPDFRNWMEYLKEYSKTLNYSTFWLLTGLWRWKKLPKGIEKFLKEKNIKIKKQSAFNKHHVQLNKDTSKPEVEISDVSPLQLHLADGFSDCKHGLSLEGVYNKRLNLARVGNIANILGKVSINKLEEYCTINNEMDIFQEGGIVVKGKTSKIIKKRVKKLNSVILRAMECIGCGICLGRCEHQALKLDDSNSISQIIIIEEQCSHCGKCLGPCPVENFNNSKFFEM